MNYLAFSQDGFIISSIVGSFLIWILYLGLFLLWFYDGKKWKEVALHALLASLIAWFLSQIIKDLMPVVRPYELNGNPPLTLIAPNDPSFPSGHAAISFAMATTIWLHDKKVGVLFFIGALLVSIGRVIANVHYPVDVLAGAILGSSCSLFIDRVHPSKYFQKSKK